MTTTKTKPIARNAAVRRSAAQLNFITVFFLWLKGKRDGKNGVPRQNKEGVFLSPHVRKELDTHNQFDSKEWLLCERDTAQLHIEAGKLEAEIAVAEREVVGLEEKCESAAAIKMTRAKGEGRLSDDIIAARRRRELGINPVAMQSELRALEKKIEEMRVQLKETRAAIAETENFTRLRVEKNANRTYARILSYWDGALRAHKELPPEPEELQSSLETSGEATYMARHYQAPHQIIEEEVA